MLHQFRVTSALKLLVAAGVFCAPSGAVADGIARQVPVARLPLQGCPPQVCGSDRFTPFGQRMAPFQPKLRVADASDRCWPKADRPEIAPVNLMPTFGETLLARSEGLEPPTFGFEARRSIRLS